MTSEKAFVQAIGCHATSDSSHTSKFIHTTVHDIVVEIEEHEEEITSNFFIVELEHNGAEKEGHQARICALSKLQNAALLAITCIALRS